MGVKPPSETPGRSGKGASWAFPPSESGYPILHFEGAELIVLLRQNSLQVFFDRNKLEHSGLPKTTPSEKDGG